MNIVLIIATKATMEIQDIIRVIGTKIIKKIITVVLIDMATTGTMIIIQVITTVKPTGIMCHFSMSSPDLSERPYFLDINSPILHRYFSNGRCNM